MIIRQAILRAGRRAISRPRPAQRWMSSEVETLEKSFDSSKGEMREIEALLNSVMPTGEEVQPYDPEHDMVDQATVTRLAAENYLEFQRQKKLLGNLGAKQPNQYQPRSLVNKPPRPADITLELLLASQSHLGHSTSLWNPANAQYIHGIRDGIHIISLDVTAAHLRRAAKVVSAVCEKGGLVLFAGTREGQERCVVKAAKMAGGFHLFERWTPGTITNAQQILGNCRIKVVDEFDEEVPGFDEQMLDRACLKPHLVVCLNPMENYVLLHECAIHNIPTIGIIDTNANPTWVTYPIPANDDSVRCVQVIAGVLGRAGQEGRAKRLAAADQGIFPFDSLKDLHTPGGGPENAVYPKTLKLGETIQDLEEADRPVAVTLKEQELQRELYRSQRNAMNSRATKP